MHPACLIVILIFGLFAPYETAFGAPNCGELFQNGEPGLQINLTDFLRLNSFEKVAPYLRKNLVFTVGGKPDRTEKTVATRQTVNTLSAFSKSKRRLIREILNEASSDASRALWSQMQGEVGTFRKAVREEIDVLRADGVQLSDLAVRGLNFLSAAQLMALAKNNFTFDWSREVDRSVTRERVLQVRERGGITPVQVALPKPSVFQGIEIGRIFIRHADGKIQIHPITSGDASEIDNVIETTIAVVQIFDDVSNPMTEIEFFHNHPGDSLSPLSGGDARASRAIRTGLDNLGRADITLRTHAVQKLDGTVFIYSASY